MQLQGSIKGHSKKQGAIDYSQIQQRILVIQMDKDDSDQGRYSQLVNSIFGAQRINVTIDALILRDTWYEWAQQK